jgi:hypothetical protein
MGATLFSLFALIRFRSRFPVFNGKCHVEMRRGFRVLPSEEVEKKNKRFAHFLLSNVLQGHSELSGLGLISYQLYLQNTLYIHIKINKYRGINIGLRFYSVGMRFWLQICVDNTVIFIVDLIV